jgi:hypothetical protein
MTNGHDSLEQLLTAAGWPPAHDLNERHQEVVLEIGQSKTLLSLLPLAKRGWVTWFDAEGDFQEPQAHSQVIVDVLQSANLDVQARDEYLAGFGCVVTVRWFDEEFVYMNAKEDDSDNEDDRASDWADVDLITSICAIHLERKGFKLTNVRSGDQTIILVVIPDEVNPLLKDIRQPRLKFVKPRNAVRCLTTAEALRAKRSALISEALTRIRAPLWQHRREACTETVSTAMTAEDPKSLELLRLTAESPDSFVSDWALKTFKTLFGDAVGTVAELRAWFRDC